MMKVLFIASSFYPKVGGVEKHVLKLSEELIKRGHEVRVITEFTPDFKHNSNFNYQSSGKSDTNNINSKKPVKSSYFAYFKYKKIEIFAFKFGRIGWFRKFRIWGAFLKNRSLFKDADVVHCHDVFFWYLPLRIIFPTKKVYTTFHGYEGNSLPTKKAILIHKLSEVLSKGNICVGNFFKKWYGTNPTIITYGASDIYLNVHPKKRGKRIRMMFLGRLEEETGVIEYIKALVMLKNAKVDFLLDVYGDGRQKKEAQRLVKMFGLGVNFKGFDQKAAEKIINYDVLFCSRYLGILEGLASKTPVFAVYNNQIKKDYLLMPPFSKYIYVSKDSSGIFGDIFSYLKNEKEARSKVIRGYEWVKKMTWEKMADNYENLWQK